MSEQTGSLPETAFIITALTRIHRSQENQNTTAVSQKQFNVLTQHLSDSSREMQKSLKKLLELPVQVTSDFLKMRATEDSNMVFARRHILNILALILSSAWLSVGVSRLSSKAQCKDPQVVFKQCRQRHCRREENQPLPDDSGYRGFFVVVLFSWGCVCVLVLLFFFFLKQPLSCR